MEAAEMERTWIVKTKYMTVPEIQAGVPFDSIKADFQEIVAVEDFLIGTWKGRRLGSLNTQGVEY